VKHNIDEKINLINKYAFCNSFKRIAVRFEEKMNEFYRNHKDLSYALKKEGEKNERD
jgi:hypothetical protein